MPKHWMRNLAALLVLTVLIACKNDDDKKLSARQRAIRATNVAKEKIAAKQYGEAITLCEGAEGIDETYDEAKYCIVAANIGAMAETVSDIMGLVATQLAPPSAYQTQKIDVKPIIGSMLDDVEAQIRYIDAYSFKLAKMENPKFHIEDFPLDFDPTPLLKATGVDEIKVSGELSVNLKGTWDMSEVLLLAGGLNALQGVVDYLMAHELVLESTDVAFDSTAGIAAFLAANPQLVSGDPEDVSRLEGDDLRKGLKNDVIAALSYLVGRDADLTGVAAANAGLRAAIKQSAADAEAEAVLRWTDKDGDGIPEQASVPALETLRTQILDQDGNPVIESSTFDNDLSVATWESLIALGEALRDNVEADGGEPITLTPVLEGIVADLKADHASTRILQKNVPDVVAVNPGVFLAKPKYVEEMLPFFYQYAAEGSTGTHYDLAIESEKFDGTDNYLEKMGLRHGLNAADFGHFSFGNDDTYSPAFTVSSYTFTAFEAAPAPIAADGVKPTAKTPRLLYVALADPTFGGLLYGDPNFGADGSGGNYEELTNLTLWKGVNKLLKYYCLDATEIGLAMFDDEDVVYASNKISGCDQPLE